ncbi:MAG TPA: siderophore-interacting protein [Pilimelia sp.]|nr:siderophore-interacting protein [Pilimelia sp.]
MPRPTTEAPYRLFPVTVRRLTRLSPSFLRVTFTGADLCAFADNGRDQRIKLLFPAPVGGHPDLPDGRDWYAHWRGLPDQCRPPLRTYTVRAARPEQREVDVDMVLHGDGGPAARWAGGARPGDPLVLVGPNARHPGDHGGTAFRPPRDDAPLLIAGDETAVPAAAAILAGLPGTARGEALLEVPHPEDALPLDVPTGVRVTWLPRAGAAHGAALVPAVTAAATRLHPGPAAHHAGPVEAPDAADLLWDVPDAPPHSAALYAWLAGEAGVIRTLRRHLVSERGLDRRAVAFMGYWRIGHAETA